MKDYTNDFDITVGRGPQSFPLSLHDYNEKELQAQLIVNEFSYTDAFRARVETLRQQRRAAEDFGDEPDEGEESEEEEEGDDDRGRTPEEQRDLEASVVYFSQGFRVLLLRHRALVGDDLHQVLHIPAQWPASRTVSAIEGLWRDLATKQWLLLYARDPTRDSMAIRPGEIAALVVARDELPPHEIPIAQEIDLTAHSTTFRQQEISQEFRTPLNSRGRLLKKSGYYDYCDASRTERRWHCYVFVDGVAWMDEIERTLRPASHVLIRINPRQDLPTDEFLFVQGETTSFAVTHFPLRTIYTTVAFHRPWTITAGTLLEDYNRQTWFLHDLGRSTVNWWTVWRHIHGDRTVLTFIQTPIRLEAWKTLDAVAQEWNDLATALWEMVEPNQYWRQSPTMKDNDFLVLLLNDVDTAKDDSLIVCEFLPSWQAWLNNVHRILTYDEAYQLFWEEGMQIDQFQRGQLWLNGVVLDREAGDLRLDHGDILSFSCPHGVQLWISEGIPTEENLTSHETPSSSVNPTSTASPTRTTSTGPMSNIVAMPDPPDHGFQPDYHFDNTSAVATFSFTEEFTDAIRLRQQGSVAPFPNFFGRRGADLPDEEEEPPRRNDEENRRLRASTTVIPTGIQVLCVRYAAEGLGDLYGHITFQPHDPPEEWIRAVEYVWPALSYRAWHFVAIHDPIRESHVIQPSTDALLIAVQTEGRWPRVRVAFEVDKLDRSFRNRVQELTQQQVPTVVNRIQLIAFSDFSDLCDPTRNERCFHCYMYLNGVALMDEDMQAVREGDHLLLRIIPRADLPAAYFAVTHVSATGFDEQNFPRRVVHSSLVPTVAPWNIPHNVALDTYCIALWTNHGGAVLQQRWFTVWRVRSIVYHRVPSMRVRRVHPQDAWVMIDKIHSQWPDLQPREWSLMQVHGSYLLSPFLARHAQLVILQTPLDTPHNFATVVLHRENTDAWASAIPRRVSLHQLSCAFGFTDSLPSARFTRNGVPLEQGGGIYDAFHGDLFTLLPETSLGVSTLPRTPVGSQYLPSGSPRSSEPYRNRGPPRDYGGYSRSGASSSTMRPTDSIATANAYPLERDSMPLRTFQQLDAQPVTHSFTDEFLQRWRDIVTARQNGAPPAPQEGPRDLASDLEASPWGAARISRTQVLRPLRLGWNTIWRRHQHHGAAPHHDGDPLDHLELHLIPHLTLEDIFELIFAYWPDLRPDNQWFLSTADDSIQYAQRARRWRGELFFLNSILDGRPGHQIVAFELPAPQPLVLRYVPEAPTYWEIRHHLQAIPDEHILLNGIPWTERDQIELSNGDFLCAKLLRDDVSTFGNEVAVNFRISRSASQHDTEFRLGGQPRTGTGGVYPVDRPAHPPTPDDHPSDQVPTRVASPFRFYKRRQRQGNKAVTFNDVPEYRLFDDDSYFTFLWQPEILDLNSDPFPLPDITREEEDDLNSAQACVGDDCLQVFDMDTNHWSLWPWQEVHDQTFRWAQEAHQPHQPSQSGWIPPDHVHDLHQAIMECPWFAHLNWHIPVPSDDHWYHSNTLCALPFVTTAPAHPIVKIIIYTDGSYQPPGIIAAPATASWSNVILVQTSAGTLHYWGHLAAQCEATSAYEAEVDAMMVALLFSYYVSQCQEIAVEIRFDCTSADFVASFPSRAACKYPTNVTRGI